MHNVGIDAGGHEETQISITGQRGEPNESNSNNEENQRSERNDEGNWMKSIK
jgi:hypothetical protein